METSCEIGFSEKKLNKKNTLYKHIIYLKLQQNFKCQQQQQQQQVQ